MYLKTYENEGLTQLDHVGTYRRAVLKPTLNWWVSSEAEILLKGKAPIDFQRITHISSETPQTGPRVLHRLRSTHRKLSYCCKGPPANCHILSVTTHHLLSHIVPVHSRYRSSRLN